MNEKYIINIEGVNIECFFNNEEISINEVIKKAFEEYVSKNLEYKEQ